MGMEERKEDKVNGIIPCDITNPQGSVTPKKGGERFCKVLVCKR